jgi:V8-like Glu-specific endopeptidase
MVFYPSGYPWQCMGRLFVWSDASSPNWSSYGSACLIGTRAILTAAHMVPWGSQNWKALFVAGYYDGNSTAGVGGQSWVTNAHGYAGNSVSAHDMAVMRLQDPLGSWLGYMGFREYDDSWEGGNYWSLVGYPSAISSERPSWQGGIHVIDDDEDGEGQELEHHGDDTGGDSGGPFYGTWSDGPYCIGTVSGYEVISGGIFGIGDEDNNIAAGGPALNGICNYARQNWP